MKAATTQYRDHSDKAEMKNRLFAPLLCSACTILHFSDGIIQTNPEGLKDKDSGMRAWSLHGLREN